MDVRLDAEPAKTFKMIKTCEQCGKEYDATKPKQRFCSDKCRQRAHRERQQDERKKALKADKDRVTQPRRTYTNEISATDPRRRLIKMRARGLLTWEYWNLYAEVDQTYYGGGSVVNGVPTDAPHFAYAVLEQIEIDGRIICQSQVGKKNNDI